MNLKTLLLKLPKDGTPDEEERGDAAPSEDSQNSRVPEKVSKDIDVIVHSNGTTDEHDVDRDDDDTLPKEVSSDDQPDTALRRILSRVLSFIFPSPSDEEEIQAYIPHYRHLPILSGIIIPFCILLEIPGLTERWYIRTDGSSIVDSKPNPPLFVSGIALSILCAVLANVCLVARFLEYHIKTMTILCTLFLSIHDIINVVILVSFGATKGDYTYGQAFWMTLCSTLMSMLTNITLIIDLIRTTDFKRSGSGLTRKQRSLVIIIIGLFCYLAVGALINALLLKLTFINGLYFTVVTIETIGFGDIVPNSTSSRVFVCFYATLGVINIAFVVGYVRETVLESLDFGYRRRLSAIQERRRAARLRKRAEHRWKHAIVWRLRERHERVWIPGRTNDRKSLWSRLRSGFWRAKWGIRSVASTRTHQDRRRPGMMLNLWALSLRELEAAALEAGVPLDTLLPADFFDTYHEDAYPDATDINHHSLSSCVMHPVYNRDRLASESLTVRRLGAMAAMLMRLGFSVYQSGGSSLPRAHDTQGASAADGPRVVPDSSISLQTSSSEDGGDYRADVMDTEKKAYYTRSGFSWGWFFIFWMGGAAIFKATEGWTYGSSVYFCFIAFSTIGYGDLSPTTPAGRSIFVVWALVGVATMTIFISVVSEAYASRYKGILGRNSFKHIVHEYRQRTKSNLNNEVQRIGTLTRAQYSVCDMLEAEETKVLESELLPASRLTDDSITPAGCSTYKPHPHAQRARQSLQQIPQQILTETRSIQQYMRLIGDVDDHTTDPKKVVNESIWKLVDEVMSGRQLTENTKVDILKDEESRQTLMMLGIERSLKELVSISEQMIVVMRERDRIVGTTKEAS